MAVPLAAALVVDCGGVVLGDGCGGVGVVVLVVVVEVWLSFVCTVLLCTTTRSLAVVDGMYWIEGWVVLNAGKSALLVLPPRGGRVRSCVTATGVVDAEAVLSLLLLLVVLLVLLLVVLGLLERSMSSTKAATAMLLTPTGGNVAEKGACKQTAKEATATGPVSKEINVSNAYGLLAASSCTSTAC